MPHKRSAVQTRGDLLASAAKEIHLQGYQAASLSKILADARVTKGALYHHFKNKQALGYAVVDEIWEPMMHTMWIAPLLDTSQNPIDMIISSINEVGKDMDAEALLLGCPINNLAQEMSAIDEGFRERLNMILVQWRQAIQYALSSGQQQGTVNKRISTEISATMIVASLEGCIGVAKNAQSVDLLMQCAAGIIDYLNTLRI